MYQFSFKKILLNPLVWIGVVLAIFTIQYEGLYGAYGIFYNPITYRNLAIGSCIYVLIFRRQYTRKLRKLDIGETLICCLETMSIILFVWMFVLGLYVEFHTGGELYSEMVRHKLARAMER